MGRTFPCILSYESLDLFSLYIYDYYYYYLYIYIFMIIILILMFPLGFGGFTLTIVSPLTSHLHSQLKVQ